MQPLKILNNVQKARLLHALLYEEMPQFIEHLQEVTDHILENREEVTNNWKERFLTAELWITLAEDASIKLHRYGKELVNSSTVFADQLFSGYTSLYTVHQLINYGDKAASDPKFTMAVELLFI